jgi:hypothetical protein
VKSGSTGNRGTIREEKRREKRNCQNKKGTKVDGRSPAAAHGGKTTYVSSMRHSSSLKFMSPSGSSS